MALSDLISKPVVAPLEGFDKSVQTGFELAQNQERLRIAQENVNLQQQQISDGFMTKAIGMLPAYLRATGKSKKMIGNAFASLWQRSGNAMNPEVMDLINSDDDMSNGILGEYQRLNQLYNGDPVLVGTALRDRFGSDQTDFIEKMLASKEEAKLRRSIMLEQQGFITGRQLQSQSYRSDTATTKSIEDTVGKTNKNFDSVIGGIQQVESKIGTVKNPIKADVQDVMSSLATFARTVQQEKGPLTEGDVGRVFARTFGLDVAKVLNYFSGKEKAPPELLDKLRKDLGTFKTNLSRVAVSNLLGYAERASKNPITKAAFVSDYDENGKFIMNYGKTSIIDEANRLLERGNIGVTGAKFPLQKWIAAQKARPTAQEIDNAIKDALSKGVRVEY
jgi:hypothetical protein